MASSCKLVQFWFVGKFGRIWCFTVCFTFFLRGRKTVVELALEGK